MTQGPSRPPAVTLKISVPKVTDSSTADVRILSYLLDQIPRGEAISSVSSDSAYDTKGCHEVIAQRGRKPSSQLARTLSHRKTEIQGRSAMPSLKPHVSLVENLEEVGSLSLP
jgi:hypothetical protein